MNALAFRFVFAVVFLRLCPRFGFALVLSSLSFRLRPCLLSLLSSLSFRFGVAFLSFRLGPCLLSPLSSLLFRLGVVFLFVSSSSLSSFACVFGFVAVLVFPFAFGFVLRRCVLLAPSHSKT